jgi:hypothetical protein
MSKERELLQRCAEAFNIHNKCPNLIVEIQNLLAQPEQMIQSKNIPEKCPDCGSAVGFYHSADGTRAVCKDKCKGYKVIASRKRCDHEYVKGDNL